MKNMVVREAFRKEKVEHEEEIVMEVFALQKEMIKNKTNVENLLKKNKDLDLVYINNRLEKYDDWSNIILYCIPNNKWNILMLNLMNGGSW